MIRVNDFVGKIQSTEFFSTPGGEYAYYDTVRHIFVSKMDALHI